MLFDAGDLDGVLEGEEDALARARSSASQVAERACPS